MQGAKPISSGSRSLEAVSLMGVGNAALGATARGPLLATGSTAGCALDGLENRLFDVAVVATESVRPGQVGAASAGIFGLLSAGAAFQIAVSLSCVLRSA
jgi:hypothetical protein